MNGLNYPSKYFNVLSPWFGQHFIWIYTELEHREYSDLLFQLWLHSSYPIVRTTNFSKIEKGIKVLGFFLILFYFDVLRAI